MTTAGQSARERAAATLAAVGVDAGLFGKQLDRLADLNDDLALARERWVRAKKPMTEMGSHKQRVPHTLLKVQAEYGRQILALESELGLTLLSQRRASQSSRGGRPKGAASAADRVLEPPVRTLRSVT